MENNFRRIQCKNCGGIMSPDQRTHSFQCPWCESRLPWHLAGYTGWPAPWRHKPLIRVEGLLKLGHVEIMEAPQIPLWEIPWVRRRPCGVEGLPGPRQYPEPGRELCLARSGAVWHRCRSLPCPII